MNQTVTIQSPIKVISSDNYYLVIQDDSGTYHYWNDNGEYDGWSKDTNINLN